MSSEQDHSQCCGSRGLSVFSYFVTIVVAILLVWWLNNMLRDYTTKVETENRAARGVERKSERRKIDQKGKEEDSYGWVNEKKGIVRLPVDRGMELILDEYSNKKTARNNLNARLAKANYQPPKAPEKPSDFE